MNTGRLASSSEQKVLNVLLESDTKMTVKEVCKIIKEKDGIEWNVRTVSTFLVRLEEKKLVEHEKIGITNHYYPIVEGEAYKMKASKNFLKSYFNGSFTNMLSAFTDSGELTKEDVKELRDIIDKLK
ncbi:BlaI/MecI/CopY family transcriptional regulator [Anaerotignum sp. MB30-C6]|uniref:BlaI/MecI/CopY family transcriptional regulator n=1 Tax=Anaerotignum sp. MB30-C6 TaxID=3070814 RepID=UPI0027DCF439|nr:BlaI/MecI/CopY family transcriptional regulator [Anaerotignum sp. MB30-C6]WMI79885.1 BlaI/MecI/CopY family transcriptional regulator [Anaerotignum sp. MB30-C6]